MEKRERNRHGNGTKNKNSSCTGLKNGSRTPSYILGISLSFS